MFALNQIELTKWVITKPFKAFVINQLSSKISKRLSINIFVIPTNMTQQPEVEVILIQQHEKLLVEGPGYIHYISRAITELLSSLFKESSTHIVSILRNIILLFLALALLAILYRLFKRLADFISRLWVQSEPNEWLVVIRNGHFVKAGVGLKTFIGPWDSVVRYPSRVERISFLANNVTLQMQGVNINGVAFWSVHRQDDGPFKCYKYMQGGDANQNVKTMCESILRNLIANSKLDDVLKKRDLMKDTMRKQLEKPLKGWGIWLESVEITEVRISSKTLFEELQAQFRNETKIKAQKSQFQAQQRINEERQKSELKISHLRQQTQTRKDEQALVQEIERIKQKAWYDQQNDKFETEKLERNKMIEMKKIKIEQEKAEQRLQNELKTLAVRDKFEEQKIKKRVELDSLYSGDVLKKYSIDTMAKIYQHLGIKEVRINQFVGNEQSDLGRLLPTLGLINSFNSNK